MARLENVLLGGESEFAYIYSGGMLNDRGLASGDTVYGGGVLTVFAGGVDSAGVVSSGGNAFVSLGGTVTGETVDGALTVSSGGHVSGGLTISGGGIANISGQVATGQEVAFAGAGGLALYNLPQFHATIGGFSTGDSFDLGGFAYGLGETWSFTEAASLTSGTLSVVDGGLTAKLTLLGNYVTSDFALSDDSLGGTFVKFV